MPIEIPNRPRQAQIATYQSTVTTGSTQSLDPQPVDAFASIRGVCRSNQAVTVRVLQGRKLDDGSFVWHAKTDVAIPAGTGDGAGASIPPIAVVGSWCKIQVINASGSTATLDLLMVGSLATTGSTIPIDLFSQLFPGAEWRCYQSTPAASGDVDLATVPAGEQWLVVAYTHYNPTGGTLAYTPQFKRSGTYKTTHAAQSVATTVSGTLSAVSLPVLDAGDILSVNTTGSGLHLEVLILKFKAGGPVRSYSNLSLSVGDNKLFECPAGYSAVAFSVANTGSLLNFAANLVPAKNVSSSQSFYACKVSAGGSPSAPGSSGSNALGAAQGLGPSVTGNLVAAGALGFSAGESLWVNVASSAGPLATVKIALFPL